MRPIMLRASITVVVQDTLFFFSSRSRHTRFDCDWSSDVCSSDLALDDPAGNLDPLLRHHRDARFVVAHADHRGAILLDDRQDPIHALILGGHRVDEGSEERRVGKEGRSRWVPYHLKKKTATRWFE